MLCGPRSPGTRSTGPRSRGDPILLRPKLAYFILGLGGLLVVAVLTVLAVFAVAAGGTTAALAPAAGLCAGIALFPALAFAWLFWSAHRRDRGLAQVGALLESYGEVSVKTMAERLGRPVYEAEQLMALSIKEGHARGRIDPETRTFRKSEGP